MYRPGSITEQCISFFCAGLSDTRRTNCSKQIFVLKISTPWYKEDQQQKKTRHATLTEFFLSVSPTSLCLPGPVMQAVDPNGHLQLVVSPRDSH